MSSMFFTLHIYYTTIQIVFWSWSYITHGVADKDEPTGYFISWGGARR